LQWFNTINISEEIWLHQKERHKKWPIILCILKIIHVFACVIFYFIGSTFVLSLGVTMIHIRFFHINSHVRFWGIVLAVVFALIPGPFLYAAPSSGGMLTIITIPERAEVWIDDGYVGLTPIMDKHLATGKYTLRLVDPSRQKSASETVVITDGERLVVERSLGGSYAKLRVDTDPQGADVAISTELGKTPLINEYLTTGQYMIEIRHPNAKYLPIIKDVSFIDGQPITISHKLEKPPIFTTKRCIQLALGTGSTLAWVWAIVEQHTTSSSKQKLKDESFNSETDELSKQSKEAGIRRTVAIATAASLTVALQVTIFIW
jgi:hypothetical protein